MMRHKFGILRNIKKIQILSFRLRNPKFLIFVFHNLKFKFLNFKFKLKI